MSGAGFNTHHAAGFRSHLFPGSDSNQASVDSDASEYASEVDDMPRKTSSTATRASRKRKAYDPDESHDAKLRKSLSGRKVAVGQTPDGKTVSLLGPTLIPRTPEELLEIQAERLVDEFREFGRRFEFDGSRDSFSLADFERIRKEYWVQRNLAGVLHENVQQGFINTVSKRVNSRGADESDNPRAILARKVESFRVDKNLPRPLYRAPDEKAQQKYQELQKLTREELLGLITTGEQFEVRYVKSTEAFSGDWDPISDNNPLRKHLVNVTTLDTGRASLAATSHHFVGELMLEVSGAGRLSPDQIWSDTTRENLRIAAFAAFLKKTMELQDEIPSINTVHGQLTAKLIDKGKAAGHFPLRMLGAMVHWIDEQNKKLDDIDRSETPIRILDPSSGWGDRLTAAFALRTPEGKPKVAAYTGIDPNTALHVKYQQMIHAYREWGDNRTTQAKLIDGCAEDKGLLDQEEPFDLVFTSPPYGVEDGKTPEAYADDDRQSYRRHPTSDRWKEGFLKPMATNCWEKLKPGGYFVLNMSNSQLGNGICEALNDHLAGKTDAVYVGCMGMRRQKFTVGQDSHIPDGTFVAEPVWIWRKKRLCE